MPVEVMLDQAAVFKRVLDMAVNLSALRDRRQMLDMILQEARHLTQADAGSLFILQDGRLEFVAAQNDSLALPEMTRNFAGRDVPVCETSLAGYVAANGRMINIPDAYALPSSAPFRIDHRFDEATGYRTQSVLAIPLKCPDGQCMGVLQLINRVGSNGRVVPFPRAGCDGLMSLVSMAAVTIHNHLLQEQLKQAHLDSIMRLSVAAEFRDDETGTHVRRMSGCSAIVARKMGLDQTRVELIQYASPMHDIGKIGIPDAILLKPGPLTPDERAVLQTHATIGAKILENPQSDLIATARQVALTHHEKYDGTGYPNGLSGDRIPLCGRIVGLADVFDALVSKRCYKEALLLPKALDIVRQEEGKHFDPKVVRAFFASLKKILKIYEGAEGAAEVSE